MALNVEQRDQMIARLVEWVQAKGLEAPAILFLQINEPLAAIGSHLMLLAQPLAGLVGPVFGWFDDDQVWEKYALLFQDPDSIEQILTRLE